MKPFNAGSANFGPWPEGMNNRQPDYALPAGALRNAVNADIDNLGFVSRRDGYTKVAGGIGTHSGWSCPLWTLYVDSGWLKRLNADNSSMPLMPVAGPVCYHFFNDTVYFSDGIGAWKLLANGTIYQWGMTPPADPLLTSVAGTLPAGSYLAALTFIGVDGSESGSSDVVAIDAPDNSAILVSLPTTSDPQVVYVRVYLSPVNGKIPYAVADVAIGAASYAVTANGQGKELDTLGITNMLPGRAIDSYKGRMYVVSVDGKVLWYSEPFAPDRLRPSSNFMLFEQSVNIIGTVSQGIWLVNNKTWWYGGSGPENFVVNPTAEYGAPPGQAYHIPNSNDVAWMSDRGIVRAGDGYMNLQEENVATGTGSSAAVIVRERDGVQQAIASVQNAVVSPMVSQSFLAMEVIRKAGS